MHKSHKILTLFVLLACLSLSLASPARAFDGRDGDRVVIAADEVVKDDLYVSSREFILDGTVDGDVVAVGQIITINGTVNGDLTGAAQTVVINGTVTDDVRVAGSVLFLGENAAVGGDIIAAGYSLEARPGSTVGQDVVFAGGQTRLSASITRNLRVATGGLELRGEVGGDVRAEVGEPGRAPMGPTPGMFMPPSSVPIPVVQPGLTIDPGAKIHGDLEYTSSSALNFPAGVIAGTVTRMEPVVNPDAAPVKPTPAQSSMKWALDLLRRMVTLILLGLFVLWLFPRFLKAVTDKLGTGPARSLGWGVIAYAGFFVALMSIGLVTVVGGVIFGFLTLRGLSSAIVWVGLLALFGLIVLFALATAFLAKIVVGMYGGKWIIGRLNPALAANDIWPLVIGTAIVALLVALPFVGWLVNLLVVFLGLGALWLIGRERAGRTAPA